MKRIHYLWLILVGLLLLAAAPPSPLYVGRFSGDGSLITGMNASQLTSGTAPDARLSSNVPLKNAATAMTGPFRVTSPSGIYGSAGQTIGINTNQGPGIDDFNAYLRILADSSGIQFLVQDSSTPLAVLEMNSRGYPQLTVGHLSASNYIGSLASANDAPLPPGLLGYHQRTPPLFVNPWWMKNDVNMTGADVTNMVNMMIANGMVAAGVDLIWIDDGWPSATRTAGYLVPAPAKYPTGLKSLVGWIHSLGMRVGIYTSASTNTCGGFLGTPPQYVRNDVHFFGTNGFDVIKVDGCGTFGDPDTLPGSLGALKAIGRRFGEAMLLETNHWWICASVTMDPSTWSQLLPTYIQHAEDGQDTGVNTVSNAFWVAHRDNDYKNGTYAHAGPGFWLEFTPITLSTLNPSTVKARMTAAAITASCIDIGWTNAAFLPYFTNLAVNNYVFKDPAVLQPSITRSNSSLTDYWVRPLGTTNVPGRSNAVVLVNYSTTNVTMTVPWSDLGYDATNKPMQVYDAWGLTSLGVYSGTFSKTLASGDIYLLLFTPAPNGAASAVFNPYGRQSFYEQDSFTHIVDQNSNVGDLRWYFSTYGGGSGQNNTPSTTGSPNFPRIGICQLGNSGTTAGFGGRASFLFANSSDTMPLEHPDLWTNWSSHWTFKLSTTNAVQSYIGFMGGASWGNITSDPSSGIYIRWCSTFESQAKFAFIIKNGATITTNYLNAADTSFHTFAIYNDTGVTNVVACSMDGSTPLYVTNKIGTTALGQVINVNTTGGTSPAVLMDYYDFGINGIAP